MAECKGGCGFYGSPDKDNYCSICYEKKNISSPKKPKNDHIEEAQTIINSPKDITGTIENKTETKPKKKNRCFNCNARIGLTGFKCKCNEMFCAKCRNPEAHSCTFDFSEEKNKQLKSNLFIDPKDKIDNKI